MKPAAVIALLVGFLIPAAVEAQPPGGALFEETVAPGRNYDQAQFNLWLPSARVAERWQWLVTEKP
jgi:hypothetical protein